MWIERESMRSSEQGEKLVWMCLALYPAFPLYRFYVSVTLSFRLSLCVACSVSLLWLVVVCERRGSLTICYGFVVMTGVIIITITIIYRFRHDYILMSAAVYSPAHRRVLVL